MGSCPSTQRWGNRRYDVYPAFANKARRRNLPGRCAVLELAQAQIVCDVERTVRGVLMIGIVADRVGVVGRIVIGTVMMIRVARSIAVMISRMRVRRRCQQNEAGQNSEQDRKNAHRPNQAIAPLPRQGKRSASVRLVASHQAVEPAAPLRDARA